MAGQVISYVLFYGMMAGILAFVGLMWRAGVNRARAFDATILEAARLSAQSARDAAEAAKALAAHLEKQEHA